MTTPRQLPLALVAAPALSREDFLVSASNRAAFEAVTAPGGPDRRLALSGPAGAGKTHLAAIWAAAAGAMIVQADRLDDAFLGRLGDIPALVIEDADRTDAADEATVRDREERLFHALNLTAAEDVALLVTGRTPPARWAVSIPDLASRLAAMHHVAIGPPDDALLTAVLTKLFADRQLAVGEDALKYLVRRMERSFAAAERVVERLDALSLAGQRPINRGLAMSLYGSGDDALASDGDG